MVILSGCAFNFCSEAVYGTIKPVPGNVLVNSDGTMAAKAGTAAGLPGTSFVLRPLPQTFQSIYKINGTNIKGIFLRVAARLVTENPAKRDQRGQAKYYLGVGANVQKKDGTTPWLAASRFKKLTTAYQTFNMVTLNIAQVENIGLPETVSHAGGGGLPTCLHFWHQNHRGHSFSQGASHGEQATYTCQCSHLLCVP
jgi:hypothetical protein